MPATTAIIMKFKIKFEMGFGVLFTFSLFCPLMG